MARSAPHCLGPIQRSKAELSPDLVSDTQFHRPVQAVNLGADPQTAFLEGDLDQQPSEAHGQGQTAQMVQGLGVEGEDAVTNHLAQVAALHQVQCPRHHAHVDALGCGAALHVADVALQGHQVPLPEVARSISE